MDTVAEKLRELVDYAAPLTRNIPTETLRELLHDPTHFKPDVAVLRDLKEKGSA